MWVCVCVCVFCRQYMKFSFYYILYNLSFLMTTLKNISRAATDAHVMLWQFCAFYCRFGVLFEIYIYIYILSISVFKKI